MNFGEQFKVVLQKFRGKTLTRPDLIRICCVEIFGMQQDIIDQKDERITELESDVESFQLLAKEWKERCEELKEANEKLIEQANRRVIHNRLSGENEKLKEVIRVCLAIQSLWLPDDSLEYCGSYRDEATALINMRNKLEKALGENE